MKSVVWHGAYQASFEDSPMPTPKEGEVLIKVVYAGICGSDITIYSGKHWRAKPPMIPGHEFSGEVVEVNAAGSDLKVGERVVVEPLLPCGKCHACLSGSYHVCTTLKLLGNDCDGGFAEYVCAPAHRVYRIPDHLSMEEAALVEPASVATHDVRRSNVKLGDHVTVLGGGPIGLLVAQIARVASACPVDIVEISDWRLDLAKRMGFDPINPKQVDTVEEVLRRTNGKGADVVFDTAGAAVTSAQLTKLVKVHGQVMIVAMPKEYHPVDLAAFALKEIDLRGCRVYNADDYRAAINLIAEGKIDVKSMISHVMPLEQGVEGLELARKGDASMKILLKP
jgi:(R,R)-butanediol dehydrogenase / meso-butanediol dehydrogenase / diacetyl reductase